MKSTEVFALLGFLGCLLVAISLVGLATKIDRVERTSWGLVTKTNEHGWTWQEVAPFKDGRPRLTLPAKQSRFRFPHSMWKPAEDGDELE